MVYWLLYIAMIKKKDIFYISILFYVNKGQEQNLKEINLENNPSWDHILNVNFDVTRMDYFEVAPTESSGRNVAGDGDGDGIMRKEDD